MTIRSVFLHDVGVRSGPCSPASILTCTGDLQPHLPTLLSEVDAPAYLPDPIAATPVAGHGPATDPDPARAAAGVENLHAVLTEARSTSRLPQCPTAHGALHDLVVRTRLATG